MRAGYLAALGTAVMLLGACDNNNRSRGAAPTTSSAVAGIAASSTESGEPFPVNDGAFAFNDTSDTSDPRSINR